MEATTMRMMKCSEVAERLGISRTSAYGVIRELNQELADKGAHHEAGPRERGLLREEVLRRKGRHPMTARREKNGTYTSQFWYEDTYGKRRHKCKRGFATEDGVARLGRHLDGEGDAVEHLEGTLVFVVFFVRIPFATHRHVVDRRHLYESRLLRRLVDILALFLVIERHGAPCSFALRLLLVRWPHALCFPTNALMRLIEASAGYRTL